MQEIKMIDGSMANLIEDANFKIFKHSEYNYLFNKTSGAFLRCGRTAKDDGDPKYGMPEIADIEISTVCNGIHGVPCSFCYKANTGTGINMSLDTFKIIFSKLPKTVTQIAFGIGDIDGNPDMFPIFDHCRDNGVIPNVTINGDRLTPEILDRLASTCGAVAVSYYDHELTCNAVKELTDRGMRQVNIHFFLAENTLQRAKDLITNLKSEPRLAKLNAIVFLSLKQKGRAVKGFNAIDQTEFSNLINMALDNNVPIGFDSCSAVKFLNSVKDHPNYKMFESMAEPCESSIYSSYINTEGMYFPCSFMEGTEGWENGLDVINCSDFLSDIWWNEKTLKFKEILLKCRGKQGCPVYNI